MGLNPWNLDLLLGLLNATVLSWPFAGFLIGFLAVLGYEFSHPVFIAASVYSALLFTIHCVRVYFTPRTKKIDWAEQIVVITGGANGIGELLAQTLALKTTVVVLDVARSDSLPRNVTQIICDVSSRVEVDAVAEKIRSEIGHPTVLVNNAGIIRAKLILDCSEEDLVSTIDVNLKAHFWTVRAFLPDMLEKNHGHILTVSSALGTTGAAQAAAYCASKSGLIGFHESIRQEILSRYKKEGVQTTLVCPGMMQTDMFAGVKTRMAFFCPPLEPVQVVKRMVSAIDLSQSQEINLPVYVNFISLLRLLPIKFNDLAHEITGSNDALREFSGTPSRRR